MRCPNCHKRIPDEVLFCPDCGVPVVMLATAVEVPGVPSGEPPAAVRGRRRGSVIWIALGLVGGLLVVALLLFLLLPRGGRLTGLTLFRASQRGEVDQAGMPAYYPGESIPVLVRHQALGWGDRIQAHWYYEGCFGSELLEEVTREARADFSWLLPGTTEISLQVAADEPLPIGSYRVEVQRAPRPGEEETARLEALFRVVPPPGAIPSQASRTALAWLVDADGRPLREATVFAPYDVVYFSWQGDLGSYSRLETRWYYEGEPLPGTTTVSSSIRNLVDRTITSFLASPVPLREGTYQVDSCLDGRREQAVFEVRAAVPRSGVLYDDFSNRLVWSTESDGDVQRAYLGERYGILVLTSGLVAWTPMGQRFRDVAIQVTTAQVAGPEMNDYGVMCRLLDDDSFYSFSISGDGEYSIYKLQGDRWEALVPWTSTSAIRQGQALNRISVLCRRGELVLRVNGMPLARLEDDSFADGDVAVFAGTRLEAGAHVLFDDLEVVPLR